MNKQQTREHSRPRIVIVGAGFGGLWAAQSLADAPVEVYLVDRHNYHTFLPLLYQVAAAELEPAQIGYPIRAILRRMQNVHFVLGEVTHVDIQEQIVHTADTALPYEYLILATGSVTRFFGIPGAEEYGFPLKTMEDGIRLRNQILTCFEQASQTADPLLRQQLLTFVVVGGGATGVEYAGALAELIYRPLAKDYPHLELDEVTVMLLEAADSLLTSLPEHLGQYTLERLRNMKVEVRLQTAVSQISPDAVHLQDGTVVPSQTIVWTAGVGGEATAQASGFEVLPDDRLPVLSTLQLPAHANIYVIGDLAAFTTEAGSTLPMVAPVATQQGEWAAQNIQRQLAGEALRPFRYRDRGHMATIGRNAAVAHIGGYAFKGFIAWIIWLVIHLVKLIGFRNRLMVLINWAWNYLFFEHVVRLILNPQHRQPGEPNDNLSEPAAAQTQATGPGGP
jgi:NADH dehydrogenase